MIGGSVRGSAIGGPLGGAVASAKPLAFEIPKARETVSRFDYQALYDAGEPYFNGPQLGLKVEETTVKPPEPEPRFEQPKLARLAPLFVSKSFAARDAERFESLIAPRTTDESEDSR